MRTTPHRRGLYAPELLESRIAPATFIVTSLLDDGSPETLRQKINEANIRPGADTTIFQIPAAQLPGTITLAGAAQMTIEDTLTIKGPGVDKLTISGAAASRIIEIADGNDTISHPVAISGLTLRDGKTAGNGGGLYLSGLAGSTILVDGTTIIGNFANASGGGAKLESSGGPKVLVKVKNSTFSGNVATSDGGGLYLEGGNLTVERSLFFRNTTTNGNGGALAEGGIQSVAINSSRFDGNSSGARGGALYLRGALPASVTGSLFPATKAPAMAARSTSTSACGSR